MVELAVEVAKLVSAEAEILQAVDAYKEAVAQAKSAGDALAADWEGEAREVFVAEQENAYRWHVSIWDIVSVFAETLKETAAKYQDADQTLKSLIGG